MRAGNPYVVLFRRYVARQWRGTALLAALILASIGLQLLGPQLLRAFIDSAIGGAALESLATLALAFVGVALVTQVLTAWSQYVGEDLGWSATARLRGTAPSASAAPGRRTSARAARRRTSWTDSPGTIAHGFGHVGRRSTPARCSFP